jgi:MarR family transcriptional regulator, temperature-dependent positive regulator of motility
MFDHCLYFNTTSLARALEKAWAQAFEEFDLSPPQAFLLRIVLKYPGLLQSELASRMSISRPTATRAIDLLVSKDYVLRQASDEDGREWRIIPTKKAEAIHDAINAASGNVTKRMKKLLGEAEFSAVVAGIRTTRNFIES